MAIGERAVLRFDFSKFCTIRGDVLYMYPHFSVRKEKTGFHHWQFGSTFKVRGCVLV